MQGEIAWAVSVNHEKGPPPLSQVDVDTVSRSRRDTMIRWFMKNGLTLSWLTFHTDDMERAFARNYPDSRIIEVAVMRVEDFRCAD